jgi:hypothetical protein
MLSDVRSAGGQQVIGPSGCVAQSLCAIWRPAAPALSRNAKSKVGMAGKNMECMNSTCPDAVLCVQASRRAQPHGIVDHTHAGKVSEHESRARKSALGRLYHFDPQMLKSASAVLQTYRDASYKLHQTLHFLT